MRKKEIFFYFFQKYQICSFFPLYSIATFLIKIYKKKSVYLGVGRERVEVREGSEREPRGPEVHRDRRACRPPGTY